MACFARILLPLVLTLATGCLHSGAMAVYLDEQGKLIDREETGRGLVVSCTQDYSLSDATTRLVNVTLENRSQLAQHLSEIRVSVRPEVAQSVEVPAGVELQQWVEALVAQRALQAERASALVAGLSVVAALDATHHDGSALFDGVLAVSAVASTAFPEQHLLSGPTTIPPQLFLRRFLVLHLKASLKPTERFILTFKYENGAVETVGLPLSCEEPPPDRKNASFL